MSDHLLATSWLGISAALALSALLGFALERLRIPALIGALLVGTGMRHTPLAATLQSELVELLAQLGILLLLFFVGLQIDLKDVRKASGRILLLTASSTLAPLLIGALLLLALGFAPWLAIMMGMTLMPTAEIVVVPILDEFGLLHTRSVR